MVIAALLFLLSLSGKVCGERRLRSGSSFKISVGHGSGFVYTCRRQVSLVSANYGASAPRL